LQAAKDATAVTISQVADSERTLTFQVATQYINAELAESTIDLAQQTFRVSRTAWTSAASATRAGDISEDDYLKIHLQLLQFQTDASQAQLAKIQALSDLRQLLGYESVPAGYDVAGPFDYVAVNLAARRPASEKPSLRAPICAPRNRA